jgi:hypothetical protein
MGSFMRFLAAGHEASFFGIQFLVWRGSRFLAASRRASTYGTPLARARPTMERPVLRKVLVVPWGMGFAARPERLDALRACFHVTVPEMPDVDVDTALDGARALEEACREQGPFDALMGGSRGATVVAAFLRTFHDTAKSSIPVVVLLGGCDRLGCILPHIEDDLRNGQTALRFGPPCYLVHGTFDGIYPIEKVKVEAAAFPGHVSLRITQDEHSLGSVNVVDVVNDAICWKSQARAIPEENLDRAKLDDVLRPLRMRLGIQLRLQTKQQ